LGVGQAKCDDHKRTFSKKNFGKTSGYQSLCLNTTDEKGNSCCILFLAYYYWLLQSQKTYKL